MRDIHVSAITDAVKKLCMEANWNLGSEMLRAFDRALTTERSAAGHLGIGGPRSIERVVRTPHDGVDGGVDLVDAGQARLDGLDRRHLARRDRSAQPRRRAAPQRFVHAAIVATRRGPGSRVRRARPRRA